MNNKILAEEIVKAITSETSVPPHLAESMASEAIRNASERNVEEVIREAVPKYTKLEWVPDPLPEVLQKFQNFSPDDIVCATCLFYMSTSNRQLGKNLSCRESSLSHQGFPETFPDNRCGKWIKRPEHLEGLK